MNILSPPVRAILMLIRELELNVELIEVNLLEKEQCNDEFLNVSILFYLLTSY